MVARWHNFHFKQTLITGLGQLAFRDKERQKDVQKCYGNFNIYTYKSFNLAMC